MVGGCGVTETPAAGYCFHAYLLSAAFRIALILLKKSEYPGVRLAQVRRA